MIIVRLMGGLGNQMYQYAYAKAIENRIKKVNNTTKYEGLEADNSTQVYLDLSWYKTCNDHGGLQIYKYNTTLKEKPKATIYDNIDQSNSFKYRINKFARKINKYIKISPFKIINIANDGGGSGASFDHNYLMPKDNSYMIGYWQSERYFSDIRDILLKEFTIKDSISSYTQNMLENIKSYKSCSIHMRRGDYLALSDLFAIIDLRYYYDSIDYIYEHTGTTRFFIFSNDIPWCKENLKSDKYEFVFIDDTSRSPHEDLLLMSACSHNIIANSSFSWWGAWLNTNPDKIIIAPKKYYSQDALNKFYELPPSWITIANN